jgi:signal transduction histidine kinase
LGGNIHLALKDIVSGREAQFAMSVAPIGENHELTCRIAVLREVAHSEIREESKAARTAAERERDQLKLVLQNIGDPLVVTDAAGGVTFLDDLAGKVFGAPGGPESVAENRTRLDAYLTSFVLSFLSHQEKSILLHDPQSGAEVEYAARSRKVYDEHGHILCTVTVLRDFSAWKKVEQLQADRRMLEMEKFAATGKLAGTIAHEINNPMEAIKNAIYLLRSRLDPASKPIYDALKSETDRVTRIVRQMLGLYRNTGHFGNFDLNTIVEDTLTLFARPLERSAVAVDRRLGEVPTMKGSSDQFRQLLSNLVVNAADSMPSGGKLTIRTSFRPSARPGYGQVTILISDTGCGIQPEIRKRMFEPFFTTKGEKGTGLGLWIVKGIVEGHSGRILVRSTPGRWTTFKLVFPIAPS